VTHRPQPVPPKVVPTCFSRHVAGSYRRRRRGAAAVRALTIGAVGAGLAAGVTHAQTLDEQYQLFLSQKCSHLGFERDNQFNLLPGQAGPNLTAFCGGIGPPMAGDAGPGVSSSTSATGGSAGATAGRGTVGAEEASLRGRRDSEDALQASSGTEISRFETGRLAAFVSIDRQTERQRVTQFEAGRRAYSLAATFGADYRLGTTAVVGVALSRTDLSGKFIGGGDFETRSRGTWVYGSWFPRDRLFFDLGVGEDSRDQQTRRLVGLRTVTETPTSTVISVVPPLRLTDGSTESRDRGAEVGGGFDVVLRNMTFGPRIGLSARRRTVEGFVESGDTPMTLHFDGQKVRSLRSALGIQASRAFGLQSGALVAQLNLDWLHEYRDDQRVITARFAEDLRPDAPRLSFLNQAPDRNWYNLRASLVAVFSTRYSAFLSLESTFGHSFMDRYGASVGVRREF
jgi:uncharacterized protein YhjY with autotransporter beta-barrel domain